MPSTIKQLHHYLSYLLRPLARVLLRRGMGYGEFAEAAKTAFVEAAQFDLAIPGRKQTTSRVSTITGLSRKEVHRLLNQDDQQQFDSLHKLNRAARVISGWSSDERFVDEKGQPRELMFEGDGNDFALLVKEYSGDITARTIADELTRTGAIAQDSEGRLRLIKQAYIPDADSVEQFKLLSESIAELTQTIEHNIIHKDDKFFQRKVFYDNIPAENVAELKEQINQKAQSCLEEINQILVQYDRDHTSSSGQTNTEQVKLGLAMHYFEETLK